MSGCLSRQLVILAHSPLAVGDNAAWGLRSLLAEDADDNDGALVNLNAFLARCVL